MENNVISNEISLELECFSFLWINLKIIIIIKDGELAHVEGMQP